MNKILSLHFWFFMLTAFSAAAGAASRVEIKGGQFYVDGEKFFVKGIGHELGSRKGEIPWQRKFNPEFLRYDLSLIKAAGFNTMRTWGSLKEEELAMIKESGLMVIQGYWFEVDRYINEPEYAKEAEANLRDTINYSKKFDNILFYTINNEPEPWIVSKNGIDKVNEAFRRMKAICKEADPDRGVSISVAHWNECVDQSIWDLQFHNFYIYGPITNVAMGYREQLEWFKQAYAKDMPFVVGEFGLSVSKSGAKEKYGYGGNSLENQKNGDIIMYEAIIAAGLQGGCLFMWNDGWWKAGNENKHEDHAEEWFGILGIEDEQSDPKGTPRPVYYAFKEYNNAIVTSPRSHVSYTGKIPVEVYVTTSVTSVECKLGGKPVALERKGLWYTGELDCAALSEGKKVIECKVKVNGLKKAISRKVVFWTSQVTPKEPVLSITTDKEEYTSGDMVNFEISFKDAAGAPIAGKHVRYAYHSLLNGMERDFNVVTNAEGRIKAGYRFYGKEIYVKFVASADLLKDGETVRYSAAKFLKIKSSVSDSDLEKYGPRKGDELFGFDYGSDDEARKDFSLQYTGDSKYYAWMGNEHKKTGKSSLKLEYYPNKGGSWGYMQNTFAEAKDISMYKAAGVWVYGDASWNVVKIMLRDEDGERWFDSDVRITWNGWRKLVFALAALARDPYDQVKDGNDQPDFDKVRGLSLVMSSGGTTKSTVYLDQFEVYK